MTFEYRLLRRIAGKLRRASRHAADRALIELRERRPLAASRPYHRFVILSPGRAGSEMLVQRCDSHPQIRCYGELFAPGQITWRTSSRDPDSPRLLAARLKDPEEFAQRHVWHAYTRPVRAVGFKLLYFHLLAWHGRLLNFIATTPEIRIIWLERRNAFELYLSTIVARQSHVYFVNGADPIPPTAPISLDPERCARALNLRDLVRTNLRDRLSTANCLPLFYEDLVGQPDQTDRAICDFLDVEPHPLKHRSRKLARGRLRDRVGNLDELREHFQGTRWEDCFLDG